MDTQKLGQILRQFRRDQNLTQLELSKKSGIALRTITDIECGKMKRPSLSTYENVSNALGYSLGDILNLIKKDS